MSPVAHHLEIGPDVLAGNGGVGRYVLLPGSPGRAARIGDRLTDAAVHRNRRRHDVVTGRLTRGGRSIDVAAVPTGMGCPSVDIIVTELLQLGARRLLRVGTTGTLVSSVRVGDLVIASGAVRDEATSDVYTPRGYPAVADPVLVACLCRAAAAVGLADRTHLGLVHTKDSFFGREFAQGPDAQRNREYMERLAHSGVIASEMEAAHLFVLGTVHGATGPTAVSALSTGAAAVRCGAVLAVIGSPEEGLAPREVEAATEERMLELAFEGLVALATQEGVG